MRRVTVTGDIEAKGRNGYFGVDTARVWRFKPIRTGDQPRIEIEIYSKHIGRSAPIQIDGAAKDVIDFMHNLFDAVKAAGDEAL